MKKYLEHPTTWNIRHLVNETFVPSAQRTRVLYFRLTDLYRSKLVWSTQQASFMHSIQRTSLLSMYSIATLK